MATRKLIVYPNKDLMIQAGAQRFVSVSYTHLTLPTSDLV